MKKLASLVLTFLLCMPTLASAWWNEDWSFRTKVTVDASQAAPKIGAPVVRAPVLLRLHEGNFKFLDARSDGTDLRLVAADDKTPLEYHIESFDGVSGIAYLWVDLRDVDPAKPQDIWLYYGNENAAAVASAPQTYDGETALVYHFNETAGTPRDQTANGNNATASTAIPTFESLIHQGLDLNGSMQVRVPAASSLSVPAGGAFTWTAWIKAESERPQALSTIFTKLSAAGEQAPARLIVGMNQNRPYIRLVDAAGQAQEAIAKNQIQSSAWVHLAVTASSSQLRLYVNGAESVALPVSLPELGGETVLGALSPSAAPAADGPQGFIGKLDELTISSVERPAPWIALAYSSQGRESGLLSVSSNPEVRGSWFGGGYFGILLGAVTVDGWVVIALLGVMLVVSVAVIVARMGYVRRMAQANEAFGRQLPDLLLEYAREHRSANARPGLPLPTGSDELEQSSSTYRLYRVLSDALTQRLQLMGDRFSFDDRARDSMKLSLESALVKEQVSLNHQMVYLTISISGGPFLGLLGTVVGVMITFAAIAAAGDVNVNAIAPGVAAALMATVAGLAVAIPALFAYNYLTTRIRDITAELQVFANELVARVADAYEHS
jgi:biopolymer transport protein ExbB